MVQNEKDGMILNLLKAYNFINKTHYNLERALSERDFRLMVTNIINFKPIIKKKVFSH